MHKSDRLTLTLRNPPARVAQAIRRRAQQKRISLNRAAIALLEERIDESHRADAVRHHDLDDLAGAWSKTEAAAFDRTLRSQRRVDPELWDE